MPPPPTLFLRPSKFLSLYLVPSCPFILTGGVTYLLRISGEFRKQKKLHFRGVLQNYSIYGNAVAQNNLETHSSGIIRTLPSENWCHNAGKSSSLSIRFDFPDSPETQYLISFPCFPNAKIDSFWNRNKFLRHCQIDIFWGYFMTACLSQFASSYN